MKFFLKNRPFFLGALLVVVVGIVLYSNFAGAGRIFYTKRITTKEPCKPRSSTTVTPAGTTFTVPRLQWQRPKVQVQQNQPSTPPPTPPASPGVPAQSPTPPDSCTVGNDRQVHRTANGLELTYWQNGCNGGQAMYQNICNGTEIEWREIACPTGTSCMLDYSQGWPPLVSCGNPAPNACSMSGEVITYTEYGTQFQGPRTWCGGNNGNTVIVRSCQGSDITYSSAECERGTICGTDASGRATCLPAGSTVGPIPTITTTPSTPPMPGQPMTSPSPPVIMVTPSTSPSTPQVVPTQSTSEDCL